jgi:hypothetical protein
MAGTTNALQWNPTAANQETDAQYAADSQRTGGASDTAIFLSPVANKLFYQLSTYITALFQAFANKGFTTSDSNLNSLTAVCSNFLTTADVKPAQLHVAFSPTPTFDCSQASSFRIDLAGNVTSSILTNVPPPGGIVTFYIVSASPGNYSFAWPGNVSGAPNVQTQSSGNLLSFPFISDGATLFPLDTFVNFLQAEIASLQAFQAAQAAENTALTNLANAAQATANTAVSNAATAQGTANTAVSNAATAQGTANTALGEANLALSEIAALALTANRYDVTGARGFNIAYTNSYGVPIHVTGYGNTVGSTVGSVQCFVNGDGDFANTVGATVDGGACGFSFMVPAGATYEIVANSLTGGRPGVTGVGKWIETAVVL